MAPDQAGRRDDRSERRRVEVGRDDEDAVVRDVPERELEVAGVDRQAGGLAARPSSCTARPASSVRSASPRGAASPRAGPSGLAAAAPAAAPSGSDGPVPGARRRDRPGRRQREEDLVARGVLADPADDLDGGSGVSRRRRANRGSPARDAAIAPAGWAMGLPTTTIMLSPYRRWRPERPGAARSPTP